MSALKSEIKALGQTVLVLQGGGALGAYQGGVYQALHEAGVDPDWIIGTSIGAINAAILAGNKPEDRLDRLREFWSRVEQKDIFGVPSQWLGNMARNMHTIGMGLPSFFRPNLSAFLGPHVPLGAENAGYYSVDPLRETLNELIDFDVLSKGQTRLTVGASSVRKSEMRYFDSRDMPLAIEHVMASGALPPAFPAVRIDGELYWDGGILSNTPAEIVFDDNPRRNSLVFAVHIWNPEGDEPETMWQVMNRQKDVQYSSRATSQIKRQRQLHRMRHVIAELGKLVPENLRKTAAVKELTAFGCITRMHVVRLLAPTLPNEDHLKDADFSPDGIKQRWEAGYRHTLETLEKAPWRAPVEATEGFILHDACGGKMMETAKVV